MACGQDAPPITPRSEGSLEFKFQNVSAALDELGAVWISGYKPRRNVQQLLRECVTERFVDLRHDMMRAVEAPADEDAPLGPPAEPRQLSHRQDARRGSVVAWISRRSKQATDRSARWARLPSSTSSAEPWRLQVATTSQEQ